MAPNRKEITSLAKSLSDLDLNNVVQAKYAPLTSAAASEQQQQQVEVTRKTDSETSASYWDWPSEEETLDVFSVAHLEANLIAESKRLQESAPQESKTIAAHDDYWADEHDDATGETTTIVTAQHVNDPTHPKASYWDWHADTDSRQAMIDAIPQDETARVFTSAQALERRLRQFQAAPPSSVKASTDDYWRWDATSKNDADAYWDWSAAQATTEEAQSLLDAILEYEEARQMLTAGHMQSNLVKARQSQQASGTTQACNDEYWNDSTSNNYWDTTPQPGVTHGQSYWDW